MAAEHAIPAPPDNMTAEEYASLCHYLGRHPSALEAAVTAALWSEHCSYKTTRKLLKLLESTGPQLLLGPGHNAGAVEIGRDAQGRQWCAVFKMESHNHPSFLEPLQGAATGVGGILRDVLAMGARPVALLDALRFGDPELALTRRLARGVVDGIAWFGNCVGVPVVGGSLTCDESYNGNPLVNVLALGLAPSDRLQRAIAGPPGTRLVLLGSATGRDGLGGATMASAIFDGQAARQRPAVQIGDPFTAKCVIEAVLEILAADLALGVQDLGAAGLTSSAFEMAVRSGGGLALDLDRVPLNQPSMQPKEILLSESQERMLIAVAPERVAEVLAVAQRWGLARAEIGRAIAEPWVRCNWRGQEVLALPSAVAGDWAPQLQRPMAAPADLEDRADLPAELHAAPATAADLIALLGDPSVASKAAIWRNYDYQVQGQTVLGPGVAEAAVIRSFEGGPALALCADSCERYAHADPRAAAAHAVAEACRNLACTGAEPLGLSDCVNFGSPGDPATMWAISETLHGIGEAARALRCPVVSGNVSLYNATADQPILPTAMIAAVGRIPGTNPPCPSGFSQIGDDIWLVGRFEPRLDSSLWARHRLGRWAGRVAPVDYAAENALAAWLRGHMAQGDLHSALDLSSGGLAVALARACLRGPKGELGCECDAAELPATAATWFGETAATVLVSCAPGRPLTLTAEQQAAGLTLQRLGAVADRQLGMNAGPLQLRLDELALPWRQSAARLVTGPPLGADFPLYVRDLCHR